MAGLPTDTGVVDEFTGVEAALLAAIQAAVGAYVRQVELLPGVWDDEMLKRLSRATPGVYLAFERAVPASSGQQAKDFVCSWSIVVAVSNAGGPKDRVHGSATSVGAYALVAALVVALDGRDVTGTGPVTCGEVTNLFSGRVDSQGLAVYTLAIEQPLSIDKLQNLRADIFATFDARLDLPERHPGDYEAWLEGDFSNSSPDARDLILIPQDTLIVSAVFDQAHYWPASKAQSGISFNAREGDNLLISAAELDELGINGVSIALERDWWLKWGNDGKGNPALVETYGPDGRPLTATNDPSAWMLQVEAANQGRHVVLQTIGAAAEDQEAAYGSVARHRTARDIASSGQRIAAWSMGSKHVAGAYSLWTENEAVRTLTGIERGYNVAGEPEFIGETVSQYQDRKSSARTKAVRDLAQIWASVHPATVLAPFARRGLASFVFGDFNANKTTDPEDDGGTDSTGRLGFVAAMDELEAVRVLDASVPWPDEISLNSFNGRWETQLQGVRERLPALNMRQSLNQIAPGVKKRGVKLDGVGLATPVQTAVARLSDMAVMLKHPDLDRAHWAFWIGGDQAFLSEVINAPFRRNPSWYLMEWMCGRLPSRRVVLNGLVDAQSAAQAPGLHGLAGVSARRAAVLLWNDGDAAASLSLQLLGLPATLTGQTYTTAAWVLENGSTTPQPLDVDLQGDTWLAAVPPWSALLLELVATGDDPLARRRSLAAGGHTPVLRGAPACWVNRLRPTDHGRYDVARDVAYLGVGAAGAGSAEVGPAWSDLPDTLYASAAVFGAPAPGGTLQVVAEYYTDAGALLSTYTLATLSLDGLGAGTVQALTLAAHAPGGWAASTRLARLRLVLAAQGPQVLAEVYLSGSLGQAQAPYV